MANTDASRPPLSMFVGKPYIMGHTAEFIAQHLGITREEMDEVALRSHNQAERATCDGSFADEIVPVEVPQRRKPPVIFDRDEHFRPGMTMDMLKSLPPAFVPGIGTVTAGNSSGINDGSTGMVLMSADRAKELGIKPIARIKAAARGACRSVSADPAHPLPRMAGPCRTRSTSTPSTPTSSTPSSTAAGRCW